MICTDARAIYLRMADHDTLPLTSCTERMAMRLHIRGCPDCNRFLIAYEKRKYAGRPALQIADSVIAMQVLQNDHYDSMYDPESPGYIEPCLRR